MAAMTNDFTQGFALDYAGVRAKFIAAARQLGCALSAYGHPTESGPGRRPWRYPRAVVPVSSLWREQTTEQAISITQQALQGLASWSLAAAA
jgi:hypothetical protein